ncbi:LPS-assembly lipoprotein [Oxalobacteraceae bacterium GrIS 2.11]
MSNLNLVRGFKNRWMLLCVMLMSVIVISACGFHLRGASEFPFKTIYVVGSESTPFGAALRRNLKSQENARLVDSEADADVVLQLISERPEKVILSLTVQGLVREYTLNSYLTFQVRDSYGKIFLPPTTIVLHRTISYNENVVLSKASEEAMLYKDMQADMLQQVVRRLSLLHME